ncbi:MAG: DNA translocase FtsK [Planctomycetota bacterium]
MPRHRTGYLDPLSSAPEEPRASASGEEQGDAARPRTRIGFLALTLGLVTIGIFLASALTHYHFVLEGQGQPAGVLQGLVIRVYGWLGFIPAIYLCCLLSLWGGVAFITSSLENPLRRIGASFLFSICLAVLTAAIAGQGGAIGNHVADRLVPILGPGLVVTLFSMMSLASLLISTDWFFYQSFCRLAQASAGILDRLEKRRPLRSRPVKDAGLSSNEELLLSGSMHVVGEPEEKPVPSRRASGRRSRPRVFELSGAKPQRSGEQEVLDRVIEEARRSLTERETPWQEPESVAREEEPVEEPEAGDLMRELESEELLEKAGKVLDEYMAEGEERERKGEREEEIEAAEEPTVVVEPAPPQVKIYKSEDPAAAPIQEQLFSAEPPDPELLDRAARVLLTARRPMASLLQRRLEISYAEARQVLGSLKEMGVIAEPAGSGPWEALIGLSEWEARSRA